MKDHIGDAEHMGQGFFLDSSEGGLQGLFILSGFNVVFTFMVDSAGEKTAGTAGRVEDGFV